MRTLSLPGALLAGLLLSGAASAADFAADFSLGSNPNGVWSYGFSLSPTTAPTLYTIAETGIDTNTDATNNSGPMSFSRWGSAPSGVFDNPQIYRNDGGAGTKYGTAVGEVSLHPGPNGEFSVARYTAPSAGDLDLNFLFGAGDSAGGTNGNVDVSVLVNGESAFSVMNTAVDASGSLMLSVMAGDTVDFVVGNAGDFNYDSTPLSVQANLAPVPEPASLAAIGIGVAAILRRRRKA